MMSLDFSIKIQRDHASKRSFPDYMIDGPINYAEYEKQGLKILFYLKETYGYQGCGEQNISEYYHGWLDARIKTNLNCSMLAHNIIESHENKEIFGFEEFNSVKTDIDKLKLVSNKLAHVNIKKTSGKSTSNDRQIRDESRVNFDLLKQQIELYKPAVIITGGTVTWGSLLLDLGIFKTQYTTTKPYVTWESSAWGQTLLCHFNHPSARGKNRLYEYYEIIMAKLIN